MNNRDLAAELKKLANELSKVAYDEDKLPLWYDHDEAARQQVEEELLKAYKQFSLEDMQKLLSDLSRGKLGADIYTHIDRDPQEHRSEFFAYDPKDKSDMVAVAILLTELLKRTPVKDREVAFNLAVKAGVPLGDADWDEVKTANKRASSKFRVFPLKDNRHVDLGIELDPDRPVRRGLGRDVFYDHTRGNSYVLCSDLGRNSSWSLDGKRVSLVSLDGDGEIRWAVRPDDASEIEKAAVEYFGLEPA